MIGFRIVNLTPWNHIKRPKPPFGHKKLPIKNRCIIRGHICVHICNGVPNPFFRVHNLSGIKLIKIRAVATRYVNLSVYDPACEKRPCCDHFLHHGPTILLNVEFHD
ncbi:hypothetical protein HanXRQr2_Chr11g0501791 [Helianthus annuus]|uniref:Uncharacterized protein n=1 Tax=Helianthus annuus TaxID=4232 RepID=A0A9K3HQQ1_HELAN|nr:hypothetical protein HanXRQr2_Chr11g0501791 [Helianthus annuus]KAJ0876019.1 hypothetical protein HanPSC8_Chr11g0483611 [Helianthus annuus]